MRVVIIGYVWPEPRSSAAGWRTLAIIESLKALDAEVVFACAASELENAVNLSELGVTAVSITLNCSSFDQWIAELAPDIVVFDRFVCEEQFGWRVAKACPQAMRILDTQDLHCLRDARHRVVKQNGGKGDANKVPVAALDLNSELAQRELASIWRSDLSLIISEYEIQLLIEHFGVSPHLLHYFPLLAEASERQCAGFSERRHCVVLGNFRHLPNWDSLIYLRSDIWPSIRKALPGVECHIYGAYPPPKAQQLHSESLGFLLKGWAKDSREVLGRARLLLAPLRFGAGQKGKLLEAMLCGTPSITTPIGAESMAGDLPWPGQVVAEPGEFAQMAVELYKSETLWGNAKDQAGVVLNERFDAEKHSVILQEKIKQIQVSLTAHRKANFIGQMLCHHSLQAQRYMSQWIELKNRYISED